MDRQSWLAAIIGGIGTAGGVLVGALLFLHPSLASPIAWGAGLLCFILAAAGFAIALRHRKSPPMPKSTFVTGNADEIILEENDSTADQFANVSAKTLFVRHNRHKPDSSA
jgi:hypothetical protein